MRFLCSLHGMPIMTAASFAGQPSWLSSWLSPVSPSKKHNTTAASFAGQPLSIIQHPIMAVFIAEEPKKHLTTAASIASQQLPIIMALHCWPAKTHNTTAASIAGQPFIIIQHITFAVAIAGQQPLTSVAFSIAGQQPLIPLLHLLY